MNSKFYIVTLFIGILVNPGFLLAETKVFQNGLNGYEGCKDTYVHMQFVNKNYEGAQELLTYNCTV